MRGWVAIAIVILTALFLMGRSLYSFLAPNQPTGVGILVVEGWMDPSELDQAIVAFASGRYRAVVTTGGPLQRWPGTTEHASYAERAADYLKRNGLAHVSVVAIPASEAARDRTYQSAVRIRQWVGRAEGAVRALDVFSLGPHARRSRLLFRMAFGDEAKIGVRAARPSEYDPEAWWRTSAGAKALLVEVIALAWVKCCFWPSHPDE